MARYSSGDGMTRVSFVPEIEDISEPSITELMAGDDWSCFITKDGLTEPSDQNNVDVASLCDTFDAQVVGSFGGTIEITAQRDNEDDVVWDAIEHGATGYLVIRSGLPAAALWAAGQNVRVYPVMLHEPVPNATSGNTLASFSVSAPVTSQPNLKAIVEGGS